MPSVVDLFCGIGGLSHGFVKEGFCVIAGIDTDETCRYAYKKNNGAEFILKDVGQLTSSDLFALFPEGDIKILVGCAPCQPFSKYTNRKSEDDKWKLVGKFAELIVAVKPEIVSMENVPQLREHAVFEQFVATLEADDYHVWHDVVDCVKYGVPQTRHRLVLFASKFGKIKIIPPTHRVARRRTVRHAIGRLDPIDAGQTSKRDSLHRASALSELNLQRIKATPTGGTWRDWPDGLRLKCHKKETGKSYGSVYGRMKWDEPSPTMTCQCHGLGNGRFGHPEQHRAISLREAAILQTFPRNYKFIAPRAPLIISFVGRHIGNAVPVRLGQIIARTIRKHLETHGHHL